jgi:superfamily I DNA/RNA helicase
MWDKFENNEIPITFDFYLKYFEVNRFCERITEFDLLELDEAQDSNAVTMSIVTQLPTKNIYVGDEHQSIYAFRGTLNAMNFADKLFYLSTTFRYIPHIANFANKILNGYKLEKVPIKSLAPNTGLKDGEKAYLSRNNSSMISLIAKFIDDKIPFKTIKDPDEMFKMAIALYEFRTKNTLDECLKDFENKDFDELKDYAEETKDNELLTALKMQLQYGGKLYVFKNIAVKYYKSKEDVDYYLSTAHTSKGLEWDEVELLGDFPDMHISENLVT